MMKLSSFSDETFKDRKEVRRGKEVCRKIGIYREQPAYLLTTILFYKQVYLSDYYAASISSTPPDLPYYWYYHCVLLALSGHRIVLFCLHVLDLRYSPLAHFYCRQVVLKQLN